MLTIDHFKTSNDIYGHPMGNAVLARMAEHLQAVVRSTNTPARFGGEEFVVILPENGL
jgi:diguanylate cyclase (GGDEF)-like protein